MPPRGAAGPRPASRRRWPSSTPAGTSTSLVRDERGTSVYVVSGDLAERTAVKVGIEHADAIEIVSGLKDGQTVLTSSVYGLGEKAKLAKP